MLLIWALLHHVHPRLYACLQARVKKDAKQIAASVVLEQLLPLLRAHAAAENDRQHSSGGSGAPSAAGRGKKAKGGAGTATSAGANRAERSSASDAPASGAPQASHKSDVSAGVPPPRGATSLGSTDGMKEGGGGRGGGDASCGAAAAPSRRRDSAQQLQERRSHQRYSEGQVLLDDGQLQQLLRHQRLDDAGPLPHQTLTQPWLFGLPFGVGVWPAGSQGMLAPPHWADSSSLAGVMGSAGPSFPTDLSASPLMAPSPRPPATYQTLSMVREATPASRGGGSVPGGRGGGSRFPEPLGIRGAVGKAQSRDRQPWHSSRMDGGGGGSSGVDSPHSGRPLLGLFSSHRGLSRSEDGTDGGSGEQLVGGLPQDPWVSLSQKRRHNDLQQPGQIWGGGGLPPPPQRQGGAASRAGEDASPPATAAVATDASAGLLLPPDQLVRLEALLAQQNLGSRQQKYQQQQQGLQGMLLGLQQMQGGNVPSIWQPPPPPPAQQQQLGAVHPMLSALDLSDPVVSSPRSAFVGIEGGWQGRQLLLAQHQSGAEGGGNLGSLMQLTDLPAALWNQMPTPPSLHPPAPTVPLPVPPQQSQQKPISSVQEVLADVQRLMQGAGIRGGEASSGADLAWIAAGLLDESAEG